MWETNIGHPTYTVTKSAGTQLVQLIAEEVQPEEMQIVSMHPGGLLTPAIKALGIDFDESKEWDHRKSVYDSCKGPLNSVSLLMFNNSRLAGRHGRMGS